MGYEYSNWQGLIEQLVRLFSRHGYQSFSITNYPWTKFSKWREIDEKLIRKYCCDRSAMQRYRSKKKGVCSFRFLRWKSIAIILKTDGELPKGIVLDDKFHSIKSTPLRVQISEVVQEQKEWSHDITLEIVKIGGKVSVRLSEATINGLMEKFKECAKTAKLENKPRILISAYDRLNGFPSFSLLLKQKRKLKKYCIRLTKLYGLPINENSFRFMAVRVHHPQTKQPEESGSEEVS